MEQAGILGNLMKYDEFTYSKMLTQGYKLGLIEANASTATTPTGEIIQGQKDSQYQQQFISQLNQSFIQQRWDIKLSPRYDPNTVWELEERLDTILEYARQIGPSHGPYFLIGNAAGMFLNGLSDDDVLNRIQKINITFSSAEVKESTLLKILQDISARMDRANLNHTNVLTQLKRTLQACHDHRVILFLSATPKDLSRIHAGREFEVLKQAISNARLGDGYRIESVHSCRLQDITKALRDFKPTILHFCGHADASSLAFEDDSGDYSPIELARLVDVMKQGAVNNLRCVLLNACATAEQSDCIANEVGCVIAMKDAVGDVAAITFTRVFYNALAAGHTIDNAFEWARPEVKLLHEDSILPQMIKGGTSSTPSDLGQRATPQAKNEMSGLESGLKTLQIEGAPVKLVHAERLAGESKDEEEKSKNATTPVPTTKPNITSPVAAENKMVDPKSSLAQSAVQVTNVQNPQKNYSPAAVSVQGSSHPSAAKKQDGEPSPAKGSSAAASSTSLPAKPQSMTSPKPEDLQPAGTNRRPNTATSAPTTASTKPQVNISSGAPASRLPSGTSPSLRPSARPTPANNGRRSLFHSDPFFSSMFEGFLAPNGPFLNDPFFNGIMNQPRAAPPRAQQLQQQQTPQQREDSMLRRAEILVRQASACDSCNRPFADNLRVTCEQCNDCTLVACSNCANTGSIPCIRNDHKVHVFAKQART